MSPIVTDYRGQRRTLLPRREIKLKACTLEIVNQIIPADRDLNAGHAGLTAW